MIYQYQAARPVCGAVRSRRLTLWAGCPVNPTSLHYGIIPDRGVSLSAAVPSAMEGVPAAVPPAVAPLPGWRLPSSAHYWFRYAICSVEKGGGASSVSGVAMI